MSRWLRWLVLCCALASAPRAGEWELYRRLMDARALLVQCPPGAASLQAERLAAAGATRTGWSVHFGADAPRGAARLVLGSFEFEPAAALARALGAERVPGGFTFLGRDYNGPSDALIATFEDPERPGLPVTLYLSSSAAVLPAFVRDLEPRWSPRFSTWRVGELEREGALVRADSGWSPLLESDHYSAWRERIDGDRRLSSEGFTMQAPRTVEAERAIAYAAMAARVRASVLEWALAPNQAAPRPVHLVMHTSPAEMRALLDRADLYVENRAMGSVHVLLAPTLPDDGGRGVARMLGYTLLGEPAAPWLLDGAAGDACASWWGTPESTWIAWLAESGPLPSAAELVAPEAALRYSPHLLVPLRGRLFGLLRAREGAAGLRELWQGARELALDADLEQRFAAELARTRAAEHANIEQRRAARAAHARVEGARLRGLVLSHCARPDAAAIDELAQVQAFGANAVLLPVLAWARAGVPGRAGQAPREWPAGYASDLEIVQELERSAGLARWLAPQWLTSSSGACAAEEVRTLPAEWDAFFEEYGRVLQHYALLGELAQAEGLMIGSELANATRPPGESSLDPDYDRAIHEHRQQSWAALARQLRGPFAGALSYAARWDDDLSTFSFWSELDCVAENLFDPVPSQPGTPEQTRASIAAALETHLGTLVGAARAVHKPSFALLGCPARERGFEHPGFRAGEPDARAQQLYYAGLEDALRELDKRGSAPEVLLLWSIESGRGQRGFDPLGNPAQAELERLLRAPR